MDIELEQKAINKWNSLRASAQAREKDFDLSVADVKKLVLRKTCFYTGKKLTDDIRSVDRVDNNLGYVKGNVVACDKRINIAKSNLTISEILLLAEKVKSFSDTN